MDWGAQQERALKEVDEWLKDPRQQVYRLFGYAGTGKTTLAKHLASGIDGLVLFAAYTGKAASVLQSKGCPASTLHSLMYTVESPDQWKLDDLKERLKLAKALDTDVARDQVKQFEKEIRELKKNMRPPIFQLNPDSEICGAELVVLDECSMVNEEQGHDLLSFGKKVLVLGDPAQLPPVRGSGYFTECDPNLLLTEIHRQAAENPIIRYATAARNGEIIPYGDDGLARKVKKGTVKPSEFLDAQLITGMNKTRRALNGKVRRILGHESRYPCEGEKLVMLRNDKTRNVLNGVLCSAITDAVEMEGDDEALTISLKYEDREINDVPIHRAHFDAYYDKRIDPDQEAFDRTKLPLDFGYAMTVHKSQGSQWDKVVIVDDGFGKWDGSTRRRWLYTGITRAAESLTIVA